MEHSSFNILTPHCSREGQIFVYVNFALKAVQMTFGNLLYILAPLHCSEHLLSLLDKNYQPIQICLRFHNRFCSDSLRQCVTGRQAGKWYFVTKCDNLLKSVTTYINVTSD